MSSEMMRQFQDNPNMELIFAYGFVIERSNQMQSSDSFQTYISAIQTRKLHFDVVIDDGHVKPQVAYAIS